MLINLQDVMKLLRGKCVAKYPSTFTIGLFAAADEIAKLPTVDAVPVVYGHWIPRIDNDTQMHECSVCGARVVKGLYEYENPNLYCYHCGAKMKGEKKSNG